MIGIDRYVGVDLYESGADLGLPHAYILDYAPDFVEGIGDRLTVTTANRAEVETPAGKRHERSRPRPRRSERWECLVDAFRGFRPSRPEASGGHLSCAGGGVPGGGRYASSGKGRLDGLIVVPVDAHPEIFGPAARDEEGRARRCDLLLVRVGQRSFKIECVEVKSRQEARLPEALAERIVEQVTDTRRLLESRFFASDPPRIDAELQRARLASVLHYYADRSRGHGLIGEDKIEEIHRYIDARIVESPEITMRGYVVSLEGDHGFKKRYGDVPVRCLLLTIWAASASPPGSRTTTSAGVQPIEPSTGTAGRASATSGRTRSRTRDVTRASSEPCEEPEPSSSQDETSGATVRAHRHRRRTRPGGEPAGAGGRTTERARRRVGLTVRRSCRWYQRRWR